MRNLSSRDPELTLDDDREDAVGGRGEDTIDGDEDVFEGGCK